MGPPRRSSSRRPGPGNERARHEPDLSLPLRVQSRVSGLRSRPPAALLRAGRPRLDPPCGHARLSPLPARPAPPARRACVLAALATAPVVGPRLGRIGGALLGGHLPDLERSVFDLLLNVRQLRLAALLCSFP